MNAVIIFDVSNNANDHVVISMKQKGYFATWNSNNNTNLFNLPHNVVWRPNTEFNQALSDLNQAILEVNSTPFGKQQIQLQRCLVLNATPWFAIPGQPVDFI